MRIPGDYLASPARGCSRPQSAIGPTSLALSLDLGFFLEIQDDTG